MVTARRLPKLKYCGLTRAEDVAGAIESGADAIGLNFYAASPRYIEPARARELSLMVSGRALRVGVFVNSTPAQVSEIVSVCPLDCIQLHGDEEPQWLCDTINVPQLRNLTYIKAISWRGLEEDRATALRWVGANDHRLIGFLVDAFDPVQRGGTGKTARWDILFPRPDELKAFPLLLAGGITEANVCRAIELACPAGVDIASGIESSPGIKDAAKMHAIAQIALPLLP